jgi:hypothetical protein
MDETGSRLGGRFWCHGDKLSCINPESKWNDITGPQTNPLLQYEIKTVNYSLPSGIYFYKEKCNLFYSILSILVRR